MKSLAKAELLVDNYTKLNKKFWYDHHAIVMLSAFILAENSTSADIDRIMECRELLRKKTGLLSNIRGNLALPISVKMYLSGNPEKYIDELTANYDSVQKGFFFPSDYYVLAAMTLSDRKVTDIPAAVSKTNDIYKEMQQNHPWLTSKEDFNSALMIALSEKDSSALLNDMEECFSILKQKYKLKAESIQSLSALLTLFDGTSQEKCEKVIALQEALHNAKLDPLHYTEFPVIGGFVNFKESISSIVSDIEEGYNWFRKKDGFGFLEGGSKGRLIYSMLLNLFASQENDGVDNNIMNNILTDVIAQEIMTIMITTSVVYSSSSSNPSH